MLITMAVVFFFFVAMSTSSMSLESWRKIGFLCCLLLLLFGDSIMIQGGITACRGEPAATRSGYYRSSILLLHALQVVGGGNMEIANSLATTLREEEDEAEKAKLDAMIEQLLQSVAVEDEKRGAREQPDQEIPIQGKSEKPSSPILSNETSVQNNGTRNKVKSGKKSSKKRGQPQDSLSAPSTKTAIPHNTGQSRQRSTSGEKTNQYIDPPKANETATIQVTPPPPNAFYRFLLRKGYFGHVILITLVLGNDWIERFAPPIYSMARLILLRLHIVADPRSTPPTTRYTTSNLNGGLTSVTNEEYMGIVSSNRGYGSKKRKNEKKKREDEVAFQKLVKIGSSSIAKYKHLSIDFMMRHRLGEFSNIERNQILKLPIHELTNYKTTSNHYAKPTSSLFKEDQDDSDTGDWIVDALVTETVHLPLSHEDNDTPNFVYAKSDRIRSRIKGNNNTEEKVPSISITSSLLDSNSKDTSSIALSTTRLPLSSDALRRAAAAAGRRAAEPTQKQKQNQSRRQTVSDRDGGSGVLGRLRAATSENFLSRHLMGAYPGDALPIEEAGNAKGLFDLARKYGYRECITVTNEVKQKVQGKRKKESPKNKIEP